MDMAYGLPDGLWLPLLIMAIIILALLWKDKISKSGGGGGKTRDEDGPTVSMRKIGSSTVGEEFALRGQYDSGDGSISNYVLTMNGTDITDQISTWSRGTFGTDSVEVPDIETVECEIEVNATYGSADDSIDFNPNTPDEPEGPTLEVEVDKEDSDPGEENGSVTVTASPTRGDNPIQRTVVELPDFDSSGSSTGTNSASIRETGISPGEGYRYRAETTDGETEPVEKTGTFRIRGHHEGELDVEANHEILDPNEGSVRMWAEVDFSHTEVRRTLIAFREYEDGGMIDPEELGTDSLRGEENTGSDFVEVYESEMAGRYAYIGLTEDSEGRDIDRGWFEINSGEGPQGPGDFPEGWGAVFQNTNNNFNGVPPQFIEVLRDIIEETGGRDGSGDVTQEVGMDAYQLLLALNALEPDLSGDDNSRILSELERIREAVEEGQTTPDDLENSLRAVLHDVFGADLQGALDGLEVEGFDEDAIVQAIRNNQVDTDPLAEQLSRIEQAINDVQDQGGGELGDINRKLEEIESAVRDTQIDEELMQQFMSQLQSMESEGVDVDVDVEGGMDEAAIMRLIDDMQDSGDPKVEMEQILEVVREQGRLNRELIQEIIEEEEEGHRRGVINPVAMTKDPSESRGEGNKNEETDLMDMSELDDDVAQEVKDLKQAHEQMKEVVRLTQQIERAESEIDGDIEHIINDLKEARKYDNLIMKYENDELSWNQFKQQLQDMGHEGGLGELKGIIKDARHALEDYLNDVGSFQKEVADLEEFAERHSEHVEKVSENSQSMRDTVEILDSLKQEIRRDPDRKLSELG